MLSSFFVLFLVFVLFFLSSSSSSYRYCSSCPSSSSSSSSFSSSFSSSSYSSASPQRLINSSNLISSACSLESARGNARSDSINDTLKLKPHQVSGPYLKLWPLRLSHEVRGGAALSPATRSRAAEIGAQKARGTMPQSSILLVGPR